MKINQERVKVLRLSKAWTQQNLADQTRISLRSIQRIEKEGVASLQTRSAIAAAFGIAPAELEISDAHHGSAMEQLLTLVIFGYFSFYVSLKLFSIPLEVLPIWSIPLIPSTTILLFGLILNSKLKPLKKAALTSLNCLFLALLLLPPEPKTQLVYAAALWIIFELSKASVAVISEGIFSRSSFSDQH